MGITEVVFSPDNLIVQPGTHDKAITLLTGQNLVRGSVLGEIKFAAGTPVFSGTGNGTMQNLEPRKKSVVGDYKVECIEAAADGGKFKVETPNGERLADAEVGVAYDNDYIAFEIVDGTTDFVTGDVFTVPIEAHTDAGKHVLSVESAVDGSQVPDCILALDTDASAAEKKTHAYDEAHVNERFLTYGAGHDKDTVKASFRENKVRIFLYDSVAG